MNFEHVCEVCFQTMTDHDEDCGQFDQACFHHSPLCCPGCPCKSFEEAHPGVSGGGP